MQQTRKTGALGQALCLLTGVFLADRGRGIHDDQSRVAIDDDPVILAHQLAGAAGTHHRRDIQTAGDDGGVRGFPAHIGHKAGKRTLLEMQHVRR